MTKILILYVEAGHGHRKVAEAIGRELESRRGQELHVEVADALEKTSWLFRYCYAQIYYRLVVWAPWLWGFFYLVTDLPVLYFFIEPLRSLWNWSQSIKLRSYLKKAQLDFILFTHFFPAEVCATAKRRGVIDAKLVTIVTDVIPHAVWQNPGTDYYWVMAEESRKVLVKRGIPQDKIYPNGIPVSAIFLKEQETATLRQQFRLRPDCLTILFTSGSFGIGPTEAVLASFERLGDHIQVLVVCGKNHNLFETLNRQRFPFPVVLFGFVENMHEIMSVAALLIAKPGGATMCESLVKGLPMIILKAIPGQESYNAKWLIDHKAAFQIKKPSEIKDVVSRIVSQPDELNSMRQAIKNIAKPKATSDLADLILGQARHL